MKVFCVLSLESPKNTIISIKRKSPDIVQNTIMSAAVGFFC